MSDERESHLIKFRLTYKNDDDKYKHQPEPTFVGFAWMLFQLFGLFAECIDIAICHAWGTGYNFRILFDDTIRRLRLLLQIARQREHVLSYLLLGIVVILDGFVHVHAVAAAGGFARRPRIISNSSATQCIRICKGERERTRKVECFFIYSDAYLAAAPYATRCAWLCFGAVAFPAAQCLYRSYARKAWNYCWSCSQWFSLTRLVAPNSWVCVQHSMDCCSSGWVGILDILFQPDKIICPLTLPLPPARQPSFLVIWGTFAAAKSCPRFLPDPRSLLTAFVCLHLISLPFYIQKHTIIYYRWLLSIKSYVYR